MLHRVVALPCHQETLLPFRHAIFHRTCFCVAAAAMLACGTASLPVPSHATFEAFHEHIVPAAECRSPGLAALSSQEMLEDIATLERLITRGYAGYDAMTPAEWATIFRALQGDAPHAASSAEFRDYLAAGLRRVDDNHVGLWSFDPARTFRSTSGHARPYVGPALTRSETGEEGWLLDGEPVGTCRAQGDVVAPKAVWGDEGLTHRHVLLSREPLTSLSCELGVVELEELRVDYVRGPAFERIEAPFPWLRLRSLMTTHAGALDGFVASAREVRDEPVVVVDLRHTGGGSDRYLRRFFAAFAHEPLDYWQTGTLRSETMLQGGLNFWSCVRANSAGRDAAGRAWLDARIERAEREIERDMNERGAFREVIEREMPVAPERPEPFRGRLVVVVDRGCMSACESAVVLARNIPGALIVGENSGGVMKVGELRWYRLPASHVWISLGHRSHGDPEGEFREARGFEPRLWLAPGRTDARIRDLAMCLGDAECANGLEDVL
ncbi:MAG: S41 family peptidase [Polyangiales bacterium]